MRDIEIRKALHDDFLAQYKQDDKSIVVDELKVCAGRSIVDVAVINGALHAYEIKGKYDTLARLPLQAENYSKIFDYATIVVNAPHDSKIMKIIPEWWGIWVIQEVDGKVLKTEVRAKQKNPNINAFSVAQLLWKEEALMLLKRRGLGKGLANKRKWILWEKLADNIPTAELAYEVREILKARSDWKLCDE